MRRWQKPLVGLGLGAALGPCLLSLSMTPTKAQTPSGVETKTTSAMKGADAEGLPAGEGLGTQGSPAQEEIELLKLQVDTERAQLRLAESRLEHAKYWESRVRDYVDHGRTPVEQLVAAKDSLLMKESDTVAERAELKAAELRLAQAQRGTSSDRRAVLPSERLADLERRMMAAERAVRGLQRQAEHVELELPMKATFGR